LDHQTYFKAIRVEQAFLSRVVLDPLFEAWLTEASLVDPVLAALRDNVSAARRTWFWDGTEHVDPAKEANAQATRLANHTTTLALEYARLGLGWEEAIAQRGKEIALMKEHGLAGTTVVPTEESEPEEEDEDASDDDAEDEADPGPSGARDA
jgi:capsid protein